MLLFVKPPQHSLLKKQAEKPLIFCFVKRIVSFCASDVQEYMD